MAILPKISSSVGKFLGGKARELISPDKPASSTQPQQGQFIGPVKPPPAPVTKEAMFKAQDEFDYKLGTRQPDSAPVPAVPAPVTPKQQSSVSPIYRGENNQLFYRGGDGFQKISNEAELQNLAKLGKIEVGGEYQSLPSGAFGQEKLKTSMPLPDRDESRPPAISPHTARREAFQAAQVDPLIAERDRLRQALLGSQVPTAEEAQLQDRITTLLAQGNIAEAQALENAANLSGQGRGITLDIITGQQGALTRAGQLAKQTAAQEALPLEQRLANLIAQRGQAQQAALTQLGFTQQDIAAQQAKEAGLNSQLQELALTAAQAGASQEELASIINAGNVGEALGIAQPFLTTKEKVKYEKLSPGETLYDPTTGEAVFTAPRMAADGFEDMTPLQQLQYEKLQQEILGDTPEERADRLNQINQSAEVATKGAELLNHSGLNGAVGWRSPGAFLRGTDEADFISELDTFISKITIPKLGTMKGVLSDADIKMLRDASGTLNTRQSNESFRKNLREVVNAADHVANKLQLPQDAQEAYDQIRMSDPELTPDDILDAVLSMSPPPTDFTKDLDKSLKGLRNGKTTLGVIGSGSVTGIDGSEYWRQGLDFQVNEGGKTKGAMVKSPFSGTVIDVVYGNENPNNYPLSKAEGKKQNGGFGNQVKLRLDDGREVWVSHLDKVARVVPGQRISEGQVIGTQGNTGMTYGQTGVHLDITMKKPDGSYYTAREVAALLGDERVRISRSSLA